MKNLSNDHEDRPNQHENSRKLNDEKGHLHLSLNDEKGHTHLSLKESQWKLRPQHDQNFTIEQMVVSEEITVIVIVGASHSKGESQSGLRVGMLAIWVSSFGVEKL